MPAKADRIGDLYIAEKGNVNRMAEKKIGEIKKDFRQGAVRKFLLL